MTPDEVRRRVALYYADTLRRHGATPAGADWNSKDSQLLRFRELARLLPEDRDGFSVLDLGCGYGAFAEYLRPRWPGARYVGVDLAPTMLAAARERLAADPNVALHERLPDGFRADFAIASGLLNVRQDVPDEDWRRFVAEVVDELDARSTHGFAYNALSSCAEPPRRRADLWYADAEETFRDLRGRYRRVAVLHDSPLWEFTAIVRKGDL